MKNKYKKNIYYENNVNIIFSERIFKKIYVEDIFYINENKNITKEKIIDNLYLDNINQNKLNFRKICNNIKIMKIRTKLLSNLNIIKLYD